MDRVRRGDRGETLIEVLITMVIMGLALTALIAGLASSSRTAGLHREQADARTALIAAAEVLKATTYGGVGATNGGTCSAQSTYQTTAQSAAAPWLARGGTLSVSLEYWNPTTAAYGSTCLEGPKLTTSVAAVTSDSRFTTITVPAAASPSITEAAFLGLKLRVTSGPLLGQVRTIRSVVPDNATASVTVPLLGVAVGHAFTIEHQDFARMQRLTLTASSASLGDDRTRVVKRYF